MSAKLMKMARGAGAAPVMAPVDRSGGGNGGVPVSEAERLSGLGAADAVATLDLPNAADKMPSVGHHAFPGPIAEAMYWDDSDIVGIQGPVGSGKTTTTLQSRLRRAVMMPRSTIDLFMPDAASDFGWRPLTTDERANVAQLVRDGATVRGMRRYKLLAIRETYRQLWSTTIPSYLETFPKHFGEWSGGRGDPVRHVIRFDDGAGPIEFVAEFMAFGDDVMAAMRGVQTSDIWLNEADTLPVDVLTVGIGRIDRWPGASHFAGYPPKMQGYGQIVCDFNAPDEENWTFGVFHDDEARRRIVDTMTEAIRAATLEKGRDPDEAKQVRITFHNQPGYGQPGCENQQNLSPSYYPRQIASMQLAGRGDQIERLVYNKVGYLRAGDPVFKREFNRRIHVASETIKPEPGVGLRIGLDQGLKGAAVIGQFLTPFHWRILAELHFPQERLLAMVFGQRLRALLDTPRFAGLRIEGGWGDMAGEQGSSLAAEENATWNSAVSQAAQFRVRPQKIGTNRIQPRLEAVRAPLEFVAGGQPGLLIDPSCKMLIRGFEARYVWTDEIDASGDKRKVPDKSLTEANVMDALQYLLLSMGKPSGLSKFSFPGEAQTAPPETQRGRYGSAPAGLITGFDVTNPYGD